MWGGCFVLFSDLVFLLLLFFLFYFVCFLQCVRILKAFVRKGPFQEKRFASKIIKYRFKYNL